MSEHPSGPLYRCSPLNSGFIGFGGVRHSFKDSGDLSPFG
jgi:hypothetical protein